MTLFAMLVILMLTIDMGKSAPLLTVQDAKEILEVILPKKTITDKEILIIKEKHRARYSARRSHHRRSG